VKQVQEMIEKSGGTITPEMVLAHPYLKLTAEARAFLEGLKTTRI
jgi:hypothetical protein